MTSKAEVFRRAAPLLCELVREYGEDRTADARDGGVRPAASVVGQQGNHWGDDAA